MTDPESTTPGPADVTLAVLRTTEDGDGELRASVSRWKDRDLVQLRWHDVRADGTHRPSGRGVAFRLEDLAALRAAVDKAERLIRARMEVPRG